MSAVCRVIAPAGRALALIAAMGLGASGLAEAQSSNELIVGNTVYSIGTARGTFDDVGGSISDTVAWWSNQDLARDLAEASAIGSTLASTDSALLFAYKSEPNGDSFNISFFVDDSAEGTVSGPELTASFTVSGYGGDVVWATQIAEPVAVPEIDGSAMGQGAVVLASIGLWFFARGRRRQASMSAPLNPAS